MITFCFLSNTPSIHPCGRNAALFRHRAGRRLEKGVFVQSGRMYLSKPHPTFPAPEPVNSLPPLDCLRFFESAARLRSFAHAGEELGVTPPAVAHRIRMLERHLGADLFERGRRSVRLNRRGRAYYEEVRRILLDIGRPPRAMPTAGASGGAERVPAVRLGARPCLERGDVG